MMRVRLLAVLATLLIAMAVPAAAAAATHFVSTAGVPVPMGSSCALPGYLSIQGAVSAAAPGDTIIVCDGVYTEEVTVPKNLSLLGSGNAVIQVPATLAPQDDVVDVNNSAIVNMSGFIVRGPGPGSCGSIGAGIRVRDRATLDLSFTSIRDITDNPFSGCQNGEGIRVGNRGRVGGPGRLIADNVTVTRSQKNGITVDGPDTTAKITNTTVTGHGATGVIAQNGIQVSRGAAATISTSTISDHNYTPKGTIACGLLWFDANGVNDDNNVYLNNERDKCGFSGRGGTYEGAP